MSDLQELYRELILDHARSPRGQGDPARFPHTHHELNPSCGDEITLGVSVSDDARLDGLAWDGHGCSISMASASVMSQLVQGLSVHEAQERIDQFRHMLRSRDDAEPPEQLEDAAAFQGVAKFVMRIKCAMLGWVALEAALRLSAEDAAAAE